MITEIGKYFIFLGHLFTNRESFRTYYNLILEECIAIGIGSLFLVALVSTFMGAVTTVQTAFNMVSDFIPDYVISQVAREMIVLELAPTIIAVIYAGKVGSSMASGLGTMRITEQIDALDTMAINPLQYLIAPKLVAGLIGVPLLVAIFDVVGIYGGYLVGVELLGGNGGAYWNSISSAVEWKDVYGGILKSISFGLIVSWICCYKGFFTRQSAEGLGTATTEAVVLSSVLILVWDYFLTSVLL